MNQPQSSSLGIRISQELDSAKAMLAALPGPAVSIFGGARAKPDSAYFEDTVKLAQAIAQAGLPVFSGGGPGIMLAANIGARNAGGLSVGLNIVLPHEQAANEYQDIGVEFGTFAARKAVFAKYSAGFVAMAGGFGTLDEVFEIVTLIQTGKSPKVPVLLYGAEFWKGMMEWVSTTLLPNGFVSQSDIDLLTIVDNIPEALRALGLTKA